MSGELNLNELLRTLSAQLVAGAYVFVTLSDGSVPENIDCRMMFREAEGTTLILHKTEAETFGLDYELPCRMITLDVHSSLEAVGFIAQIARHDMGVNPVSGFFHDHLFVPDGREQDAMRILERIAGDSP